MTRIKMLKIASKSLGFLILANLLVVVSVLVSLSLWLRTDKAQQLLFQTSIGMLEDKLQTKVKADSISVELLKGQVRLYGMQINDQQDSLLLQLNELHAGIAVRELIDHRVRVTDVELLDAKARLWRDSLTSNFQFVIDAFKKKNTGKKVQRKKAPLMELIVDVEEMRLRNVRVKWDVKHKLRKNLNKPKRGAFDANHVEVLLNMKAKVKQTDKNIYAVNLNDLNIIDFESGLQVDKLQTSARISKECIEVDDVLLTMKNSEVRMDPFVIDLKKKSIDKPFILRAKVLLKDIAQPFAPVLANFTTPLMLETHVSGPLQCLNVDKIDIQTPDRHLHLTAHGKLDGLFAKKEKLNLQFRDIDMNATHNMKEQIVMHFAKKMRLKMLRQMKALGDIRFQGTVDIRYKREIIGGKLSTHYGNVVTRFTIDDKRHYMTGYLTTQSMEMGKLMNIKDVGPVKCRVDFDLNISRKTPRPATALPNGRLPMGMISAKVYDAKYRTLSIKQVNIELNSDGSTASGILWVPGQLNNISARVKYVQTDSEQNVWFRLTHSAQQWLLSESINLLKDKLQTDVSADSIDIYFFNGQAKLYGIRVKDRENNNLFKLDTLHVELNAQELLEHTVHVTHLAIYGLDVQMKKDSTDTNFGFIIDAFANRKKKKPKASVAKNKKIKPLQLVIDLEELVVEGMHVKWDATDKTRKNHDVTKKGAFDANHIDAELNMQAGVKQLGEGKYKIVLWGLSVTEHNSGVAIDNLSTSIIWSKDTLQVDTVYLQMPQSWLQIEPLVFDVSRKCTLAPFGLHTHLVLQDLAKPFAPVLRDFTTPLEIDAIVSGGKDAICLRDVVVNTPDGRMNFRAPNITANFGGGNNAYHVLADDVRINSDNATLLKIMMHFAKTVHLKLVRQLNKVGDVRFMGNIELMPKQFKVAGELATDYGDVTTDFTLDSNTHFMTGTLDAPALDIGKFLNIKHLGRLNTSINFEFNTSSKAPRPATALPDGRLPQGHINAIIRNVKYRLLHAKRVEANITSDGSTATGSVRIPRFVSDLIINFNYVQTENEQHLKVRPKHRFHKFWQRKKKNKTDSSKIQTTTLNMPK